MKRILLVMLSLGLVLAFSASAMAVDVKFSGSYYAAGMYLDKTTLNQSAYTTSSSLASVGALLLGSTTAQREAAGLGSLTVPMLTSFSTCATTANSGNSTAFYYQRLRVGTDFIVSPGLKLVTRFDALERIWGAARSASWVGGDTASGNISGDSSSAGSRAENENIAFDVAYIDYVSPIGLFRVGYMPSGAWGTTFGNSQINGNPIAAIAYGVPVGPVVIGASMEKTAERSKSYIYTTQVATDRDYEKYSAFVNWDKNQNYQAGLAFEYRRIAMNKGAGDISSPLIPLYSAFAQSYALNPYAKAKFGPVAIAAEVLYAWGQVDWEDGNPLRTGGVVTNTVKIENMSAYLNVLADFKMVYAGATLAYVSGDDPGTTDKLEGGIADGGRDWNPTLILFNYERAYWAGSLKGYGYPVNGSPWIQAGEQMVGGTATGTSADGKMINTWLFQGLVGVRPVAALDINFSATYANADKKPQNVISNALGWEFDVTGTYKLTNNLSYMLGAGYLLTGDYFQGTENTNDIQNTYILVNKLTLTF